MYRSYSDSPTLIINKKYLKNRAQITTLYFAIELEKLTAFHFELEWCIEIYFFERAKVRIRWSRCKTLVNNIASISIIIFFLHYGDTLIFIIIFNNAPAWRL